MIETHRTGQAWTVGTFQSCLPSSFAAAMAATASDLLLKTVFSLLVKAALSISALEVDSLT